MYWVLLSAVDGKFSAYDTEWDNPIFLEILVGGKANK